MKIKKVLSVVLIIAALCATSCGSMFGKSKEAVMFSFEEHYNAYAASKISFSGSTKSGVRLVDCDGRAFPDPPEGVQWQPAIEFPAGIELNLRVYVYWNEDRPGERRRGVFKCPPLEGNKSYKLWFKGNLKGGKLILTYADALGSNNKIVHEQIIPPVPKSK